MKKCFDFLGSEVLGDGRDRVYVIPVPIEWSTSYRRGTALAPEALLRSSRQIEIYNSSLNFDLEGSGIATLRPGIKNKEDLISFIKNHRELLQDVLPCFIGGEHSLTPWILDGLGCKELGIVWLDAHADLRESYLGEKESHACAARNSLKYGPMVEVGVRSYSREERDFISASERVSVFGRWSEDAKEEVIKLPRKVYLSIDYDVLDPSLLRAVGTPEPDGMMWDELMNLLTFLFSKKEVIAMDAVELCPSNDDEVSSFIGAKVIYEAVSRFLREEIESEE